LDRSGIQFSNTIPLLLEAYSGFTLSVHAYPQ
jgi:hypothetical protein